MPIINIIDRRQGEGRPIIYINMRKNGYIKSLVYTTMGAATRALKMNYL